MSCGKRQWYKLDGERTQVLVCRHSIRYCNSSNPTLVVSVNFADYQFRYSRRPCANVQTSRSNVCLLFDSVLLVKVYIQIPCRRSTKFDCYEKTPSRFTRMQSSHDMSVVQLCFLKRRSFVSRFKSMVTEWFYSNIDWIRNSTVIIALNRLSLSYGNNRFGYIKEFLVKVYLFQCFMR